MRHRLFSNQSYYLVYTRYLVVLLKSVQKRKPFYPVEVPFLANLAKSYETSTVQNIAAAAGATDGWLQSNFSSNDGLTLVEILLNMLVFDKRQ